MPSRQQSIGARRRRDDEQFAPQPEHRRSGGRGERAEQLHRIIEESVCLPRRQLRGKTLDSPGQGIDEQWVQRRGARVAGSAAEGGGNRRRSGIPGGVANCAADVELHLHVAQAERDARNPAPARA